MPDSKLISTDHFIVNRDGATYKTTTEEIKNFIGGSSVIVRDTAPDPVAESLEEGTLWWDSDEGDMFVLYNDSTDPDNPNLIWVDSNNHTIIDEGGDGGAGDYLSKYGTEVTDATALTKYTWNKTVRFKSGPSELDVSNSDIYLDAPEIDIRSRSGRINIESEGNLIADAQGEIKFYSRNDNVIFVGDNELIYRDIVSTDPPEQITNKKYVDAAVNTSQGFLQNEIVELEEEIEALAPTLQRGNWTYNPIMGPGVYNLFDGAGQPTNQFNNVDSIYVSKFDNSSTPHGFDNITVGSYIEIFVDNSPNFGLYLVTDVTDLSANATPYWVFTVEFVKSNTAISTASGSSRFKFFEISGGDVTTLLSKYGETVGDAVGPVNYKWNKSVTLESTTDYIKLASKSSEISFGWDDDEDHGSIFINTGYLNISTSEYVVNSPYYNMRGQLFDFYAVGAGAKLTLTHEESNNKIAIQNEGVLLVKSGDDWTTKPSNHIVDKQYVNDSLDFSKYPPLEP